MECEFCQHNLAMYNVMHTTLKTEQAACHSCTMRLPDFYTVTAEHDVSAWDFAG